MNYIFFKTDKKGCQQLANQSGRFWRVHTWPAHEGDGAIGIAWNKDANKKTYHVEDHIKSICESVCAVFEKLRYDDALAFGNLIRPDREIEDVDGQLITESFDFSSILDLRDIMSIRIYDGVDIDGKRVHTKPWDIDKIQAVTDEVFAGTIPTGTIEADDGEFEITPANAKAVKMAVLKHADDIVKGKK